MVLRLLNLNQAQGDEGEELDLLRMSLPQQTDADGSLAALFTALVPEGTQLNAEHIEALVHDAGLQYDAKVWRLGQLSLHALKTVAETLVKGLLLRVLDDPLAVSKGVDDLSLLTTHLNQIERQQTPNLLAQVCGEPI